MAGEWRERQLEELTENFDSVRIPVKEMDRRAGPYPYYGASGVVDYVDKYLFDGEYLLIAEDGENLRTRNTPVAFLASGQFWVNNHAHIVRGNAEADTRFLMYALINTDISGYLTGSTMPKLTQANMNRIPVLTPPLDEQRSIARILGTLDDKIELNRRMNETLEAMARALFKSWFVDFDPVRAKAEGRQSGVRNGLDNLFAGAFQQSELGPIPIDWHVAKLGDVIELAYGKALKEEDRKPGPIAVFGSNGQVGWHSERLAAGPGIVIGRKGNPGVVTWAPTDFFPIDTTFYVVPKNKHSSLYFLYYALLNQTLASIGADSAVPGLNRNLAYMSQQVVPPPGVQAAFEVYVRPIFERRHASEKQSVALAALRDTLLPKLISGELRVNEAEKQLEAVV